MIYLLTEKKTRKNTNGSYEKKCQFAAHPTSFTHVVMSNTQDHNLVKMKVESNKYIIKLSTKTKLQ